jgi:hypothetical protein
MRTRLAGGVVLLLAIFALRPVLDARMTLQMLLQIPLLIAVGGLLGRSLSPRWRARIAPWNKSGVSGLVLASLALMYWMLPRALDAAATGWLMDTAKHLSLALLAGVPLALSWPGAGFVVRGVFLLELVASCFRLGWLYLISPVRLCNNYGLDDQQRLGQYLLVLGAALFIWIAYKLLWGSVETGGVSRRIRERG